MHELHEHECPVCGEKWSHKMPCESSEMLFMICDKDWVGVLRERKANNVPLKGV